jgi:excisionase family DNA binding protein
METILSRKGMAINADIRIIDLKVNELVEAILSKISNMNGGAKQNNLDDFISAEETAQMLGIKRSTLYSLTSNRDISYFTPCKNNLFRRRDVVAYIEAHAKPSRHQISEQAMLELAEKDRSKITNRVSSRNTNRVKRRTA